VCHKYALCDNTPGSYACACRTGFSGDGVESCAELDDCAFGPNKCVHGRCMDIGVGAYSCECLEGWTDMNCDFDVNECVDPLLHGCHENAECVNSPGSFHGACTDNGLLSFVCDCDEGWTDTRCDRDVNECYTGAHDCHPDAKCMNTPGTFWCRCLSGWTGDGYTCIDLDDCDPDPCDPEHGTCTDIGQNKYDCACEEGFCGFNCDENCSECKTVEGEPYVCHEKANCADTFGSFTCTCRNDWWGDGHESCKPCTVCGTGYVQDKKEPPCGLVDLTCRDVDECGDMLHDCDRHADCHNTDGSFTCECRIEEGWTGEGVVSRCERCRACPAGYTEIEPCTSTEHPKCILNIPEGEYILQTESGGVPQCLTLGAQSSTSPYPSQYNWGYGRDWCGVGEWNGRRAQDNLLDGGMATWRLTQIKTWRHDYDLPNHDLYVIESKFNTEDGRWRCLAFGNEGRDPYPRLVSYGPGQTHCGFVERDTITPMERLTTEGLGAVWRVVPLDHETADIRNGEGRFLLMNAGHGNIDGDQEPPLKEEMFPGNGGDWECLFFSRGGAATNPSRPTGNEASGIWGHGDADGDRHMDCGISLRPAEEKLAADGGDPDEATQKMALLQNMQAVFRLKLLRRMEGVDAFGEPAMPDDAQW
jgi:hypothetical protein